MTLREIHSNFAWFPVVANAVAGTWALVAHWREEARIPALWWFTGVAQLSIFLEVALGVALVAGQDIEAPEFHAFYGFVALATVGIIYSYRAQLEQWKYLLYGLGGLFLMGLNIRSMVLHR